MVSSLYATYEEAPLDVTLAEWAVARVVQYDQTDVE